MTRSLDVPLLARVGKPAFEGGLDARIVRVGGARFGGDRPVVVAGPVGPGPRDAFLSLARGLKEAGADAIFARGGSAPLTRSDLELLRAAGDEAALPVVAPVTDVRCVELLLEYADALLIGPGDMQNFPLLSEAGRSGRPVILARALAATLAEWLGAAEYIAREGNLDVVLCECGVRAPVSGVYSRNTLDLNVLIPARQETILPVIADPGGAAGRADLVPWIAKGAVAAGAQGLLVDVTEAGSEGPGDGAQAISPDALREIADFVRGWPVTR